MLLLFAATRHHSGCCRALAMLTRTNARGNIIRIVRFPAREYNNAQTEQTSTYELHKRVSRRLMSTEYFNRITQQNRAVSNNVNIIIISPRYILAYTPRRKVRAARHARKPRNGAGAHQNIISSGQHITSIINGHTEWRRWIDDITAGKYQNAHHQ